MSFCINATHGCEIVAPHPQNFCESLDMIQARQKQHVKNVDARLARQDQKAEVLQLVLICAQDIVDAWPELTMRKLGEMTKRIDTLRQALEAARK
jgi:hypothetical protein